MSRSSSSGEVRLVRAYDPPGSDDGYRVLVDRLWPRGVARGDLDLDEWCKDVAPSDDLRKWFGHRDDRWEGFAERYRDELDGNEDLTRLAGLVDDGTLTLVYGAKDREHNQAVVLAEEIRRLAGGSKR